MRRVLSDYAAAHNAVPRGWAADRVPESGPDVAAEAMRTLPGLLAGAHPERAPGLVLGHLVGTLRATTADMIVVTFADRAGDTYGDDYVVIIVGIDVATVSWYGYTVSTRRSAGRGVLSNGHKAADRAGPDA